MDHFKGRNTGYLGDQQQLQPIRNSDSEMVLGGPCSQSLWDMDGMIWTHTEQAKQQKVLKQNETDLSAYVWTLREGLFFLNLLLSDFKCKDKRRSCTQI